MQSSKTLFSYLALGGGVLALSMSGLFVRWSQAPGPVTSFYRMAIAALILLPVMVLRTRRYTIPPRRWLWLPLLGGVFTALDHGTWSTAIRTTRVANAALLNNLAPVWVAFFAALVWHEVLNRRFWVGLGITLVGAAMVLSSDQWTNAQMNTGNLLAIASSLFYAGYFLVTQRGRIHLSTLTYVWLVDVAAALVLGLICIAFHMPLLGYDTPTWRIFLATALISQICGYLLIAYALGHLPASVVSPTMVLQPVLSALLAVPLLGEILSPLQWLGALAVVAGIYLINNRRARLRPPVMIRKI